MKKIVGEKIKAIRIHLNMNQEQFAKELKISRSALSQIESNYKGISYNTLEKLVKKLKINPFWMFDMSKDMFASVLSAENSEEIKQLKSKIETLMEVIKTLSK